MCGQTSEVELFLSREYENNINAGKAKIKVIPINHTTKNGTNYSGLIELEFEKLPEKILIL